MTAFADLLATPGVEEIVELRGPFGFMAYHGGALEAMTDVIAAEAARRSNASLYAVVQPEGMREHLASTLVRPAESARLLHGQLESVVERPGSPVAGLARAQLVVEVLGRDVGRLEDAERQSPGVHEGADEVHRGRVADGGLTGLGHHAGRAAGEAVLTGGDRAVDALTGGDGVGQGLLADGRDGDPGSLDLVGQLVREVHVDLRRHNPKITPTCKRVHPHWSFDNDSQLR